MGFWSVGTPHCGGSTGGATVEVVVVCGVATTLPQLVVKRAADTKPSACFAEKIRIVLVRMRYLAQNPSSPLSHNWVEIPEVRFKRTGISTNTICKNVFIIEWVTT